MKKNQGHARCIATGLKHIFEKEEFDYVIPIDGDKLLGEKRKVTEDTLKKSVEQTFKDIARYVVKHTKSGKATDSLINLYRQ